MADPSNFSPQRSLGASRWRSLTSTNVFLRKQLWVWPLVAAILLGVIGYWLYTSVEAVMRDNVATELQTILNCDVAALEVWMESQEHAVATAADDPEVSGLVEKLVALADRPGTTRLALAESKERADFIKIIQPWIDSPTFDGFAVVNAKAHIIAAMRDEMIGHERLPGYKEFFDQVLESGKPAVSTPFPSAVYVPDAKGKLRNDVPTMFAAAPVGDEQGAIIGAIGLRIRPEADFSRILNIARAGKTGETYAISKDGYFLSQSRFDEEMKARGLLADNDDSSSILTMKVVNPGADTLRGEQPIPRSQRKLTTSAAGALSGHAGVDVNGYRDYRGTMNVGAWTWLPEYGFGVITEQDYQEAYRPLTILRVALWGLFGLVIASAVAIFVFTVVVARLRQAMRKASLEAKQVGQYKLEEKIGSGGMGVVYRGKHALMRRPTAIKLLHLEKTTPETISRFEREVQITSQLSHPNTIAIFDYGHTPDGIFYYAMEYLDGIDLDRLVAQYGRQPEGRTIQILAQVCGSLAEAHETGLIHRDVKPANIILNERGGLYDFVKVLDFGLVKAVDAKRQMTLTTANTLTGTPLYMSPEAIETPDRIDARSDLYAVGAVGYYLLTGTPVFTGESLIEICSKQVGQPPEPPSRRLGKAFTPELEALLLKCLEKEPADRPASARELGAALRACRVDDWSEADAERWWHRYRQQATAMTLDANADTGVTEATVAFVTPRNASQ